MLWGRNLLQVHCLLAHLVPKLSTRLTYTPPTAHDSLPPLLLPWPLRIGPASLSSPQLVGPLRLSRSVLHTGLATQGPITAGQRDNLQGMLQTKNR